MDTRITLYFQSPSDAVNIAADVDADEKLDVLVFMDWL